MPDEYGGPTRTYNYSAVSQPACPGGHFVIHLEQLPNATRPIFWSAIVGCQKDKQGPDGKDDFNNCESFTGEELILFPWYIYMNHGTRWNDLGWTWWVNLFLGAPLLIVVVRATFWALCRKGRCNVLEYESSQPDARARALMYELAILGWTWAALEMLVHFVYSQAQEDMAYEKSSNDWFAFVILLGSGLPCLITVLCWYSMDHPRKRWTNHMPWAIVELASGVLWYFDFGAGFFLGPSATVVAALIRIWFNFDEMVCDLLWFWRRCLFWRCCCVNSRYLHVNSADRGHCGALSSVVVAPLGPNLSGCVI